jgi:hypothetical protein
LAQARFSGVSVDPVLDFGLGFFQGGVGMERRAANLSRTLVDHPGRFCRGRTHLWRLKDPGGRNIIILRKAMLTHVNACLAENPFRLPPAGVGR